LSFKKILTDSNQCTVRTVGNGVKLAGIKADLEIRLCLSKLARTGTGAHLQWVSFILITHFGQWGFRDWSSPEYRKTCTERSQ